MLLDGNVQRFPKQCCLLGSYTLSQCHVKHIKPWSTALSNERFNVTNNWDYLIYDNCMFVSFLSNMCII